MRERQEKKATKSNNLFFKNPNIPLELIKKNAKAKKPDDFKALSPATSSRIPAVTTK